MLKYIDLVNRFVNNPHDVRTTPISNRQGKWFYVYVEDEKIYIDVAKEHFPKCSISKPRVLHKKEIEDIYKLYIQRKQGHSVSNQAAEITMNQVYWYGIFNDLGL